MAALSGTAAAQIGQSGPIAQTTPPPSAVTIRPLASPTAAASPAAAASAPPATGRRGRRGATPEPGPSPSETPEPAQFSTMDGVWELQYQPLNGGRTQYSHLYVTQRAEGLSGTWVRSNNDKVPFTGTFDGRLFKLTATDAKNTTWTLSGYAENFSDMVGLVTSADPKDKGVPFTASHRKKERIAG